MGVLLQNNIDFNTYMRETSMSSSSMPITAGVGSKKKKKSSTTSVCDRSGIFPTPKVPPDCRNGDGEPRTGHQKGLMLARVQLPANAGRRFGSSVALLPLGNCGKGLPSKWEDAEKWIRSPVDVDGVGIIKKPTFLPYKPRRMSKSGPIGTLGNYRGSRSSASSPSLPNIYNGVDPIAGVVLSDNEACCNNNTNNTNRGGFDDVLRNGRKKLNSSRSDHGVRRPSSIHFWSDLLIESSSSLPNSRYSVSPTATGTVAVAAVSPSISTKDVATQMSPTFVPYSEACPQAPPSDELYSHISRLEVRDVKADEKVSDPRVKTALGGKINAWEKLQKAKAEASIRKLEMKLEKERACSMEKISNKLRSAQRKAKEMRWNANIQFQCDHHRHRNKVGSSSRNLSKKSSHIGLLSRWFACDANRV